MRFVTLLTDFGTQDGYVGEVKGAILTRSPDASLVDVSHDIPAGDVEGGAWALGRYWDRFPEGTVHLAVVDPGVGGPRRPVAVRVSGRWFVGPDEGLLTRVLRGHTVEEARLLDPARVTGEPLSGTFHGRDLFAPAAGLLAAGARPGSLGVEVDPGSLVRFEAPDVERVGDCVRGRVVHVDRFGNLITDIPSAWLAPTALIEVGGEVVSGVRVTYQAVEPGQLVAVVGSGGTLEISLRDGSAARRLRIERGHVVSVRPERD